MVRSISCSEIVESWRHPVLSPAAHRKYRNLDFRIFQIDVHIRWASIFSPHSKTRMSFMLIVIKVLGLQAFGPRPDVDIACPFTDKKQNSSQAKVHESGRGGA
jgi:hypothetical protein